MSNPRRPFAQSSSSRGSDIAFDAADSLSVQQAKLARLALQEMQQFVVILDGDGRTLEISAGALERLALTHAEVVGMVFWELPLWASGSQRAELRNLIAQARQGEVEHGEITLRGVSAGIAVRLRPLQDPSGQLALLVLESDEAGESVRERLDFARRSQGLKQQLDRIRQLDQLKSEFVAQVEQRLAQPLDALLAPLERLLSDAHALSEPRRADLAAIERNFSLLSEQLRELLERARLQALPLMAARSRDAELEAQSPPLASPEPAAIARAARASSAERHERALSELTEQLAASSGQRQRAEAEALALRDALATELAAMTRLHEFSMHMLSSTELQPLLEQVLNATIALQDGDFGTVQLYDASDGTFELAVQRGFAGFLEHFQRECDDSTAYGRAILQRQRVVIEDVESDAAFAPHRGVAAACGFRSVHATPLLTRRGEPLGVISTHFRTPHRPSPSELRLTDLYARQVADAIERRRAEAERSKLAALVENSDDFIGIASLEGEVSFVNRAGRELLGMAEGRRLGNAFADFVAEDERERFQQQVLPRLARTGRWDGQVRFRNYESGAAIPMLQHIFYIKDAGTARRLAVGTISRDDRDRVRSEEALRRALDELAHATRVMSLGELTATIAHEVNQPLAAIVTNGHACLRWLGRTTPDVAEARSAVERMLRDGRRASEVIDRIRSLSANNEPAKLPVDLGELIDEVLALVRYEVVRHSVRVRLELGSGLRPVLGDRIQLQQVLLNLIMNGIEAMREVQDRPRELSIAGGNLGVESVEISVRDGGVGLSNQALERLFQPFFTTKPDGIGLGLSISQRIVTAHGGTLSASPNSDHGLTLIVTLPIDGE